MLLLLTVIFPLLQGHAAETGHATETPATRPGLCALFLQHGVVRPSIYAPEIQLPFADGRPLDMRSEDDFVLFDRADVEDFLSRHRLWAWAPDLRALGAPPPGHIIYLSSYGVSLWPRAVFADWLDIQRKVNWNSPTEVQYLISHMADGFPVVGLSPQSVERVRNAYLAAREGEHARAEVDLLHEQYTANLLHGPQGVLDATNRRLGQREYFLNRFLSPPPEIDLPASVDLTSLDPKERDRLIKMLFTVEREKKASETQHLLRSSSRSLNLDFAMNMNSFEGDPLSLHIFTDAADAVWFGRILLREYLVRHLWTRQPALNENAIYLLAAFPEFLPFRELVRDWPYDMRHHPLKLEVGFYPHALGPLNEEGDSVYLDLKHALTGPAGQWHEEVLLSLQFAAHGTQFEFDPEPTADDVRRLQVQFARDWSTFASFYPAAAGQGPAPELHLSTVRKRVELNASEALPQRDLLAFFIYLTRRYPLKTQVDVSNREGLR